jgi:hypothetical protein
MKKLMVAVLGGKGDEKRILKKVEISEIEDETHTGRKQSNMKLTSIKNNARNTIILTSI